MMDLRKVAGMAALISLGALATAHPASAAGAINTSASFLANTFSGNDDGSSDRIDTNGPNVIITGPLQPNAGGNIALGFNANFYGTTYNSTVVNNNGNTTFGAPLHSYTPFAFAQGNVPIIAPFFADVDTRAFGGGTTSYGQGTLAGHQVFGVDWTNVGYYGMHTDKLNDFQELLVNRSDTGAGNFDIVFNYNQIQWETGDASGGHNGFGGTPAAVGFSNGVGAGSTYYTAPGSFTTGAFEDNNPTGLIHREQTIADALSFEALNPGRLVFAVRGGQVMTSTPEPSAWASMGLGIFGLGVLLMRARKRSSLAA